MSSWVDRPLAEWSWLACRHALAKRSLQRVCNLGQNMGSEIQSITKTFSYEIDTCRMFARMPEYLNKHHEYGIRILGNSKYFSFARKFGWIFLTESCQEYLHKHHECGVQLMFLLWRETVVHMIGISQWINDIRRLYKIHVYYKPCTLRTLPCAEDFSGIVMYADVMLLILTYSWSEYESWAPWVQTAVCTWEGQVFCRLPVLVDFSWPLQWQVLQESSGRT